MSELKTIAIDQATNKQLMYHAQTVLGLDGIRKGQNDSFLRGKIESAAPGTSTISYDPEVTGDTEDLTASAEVEALPENADARQRAHYRYDPKVDLVVHKAPDTKFHDLHLSVNGETLTIQRGERVMLPWRFFLSLRDSRVTKMVETGETNPMTGLAVLEPQDQPSYMFTVHRQPPQEEIDAWHERTKDVAF